MSQKPQSITLNNKAYYLLEDLMSYDSAYFLEFKRAPRSIIKKLNISDEDHLYAYMNMRWIISTSKVNRAKLFLSEKWTTENVPKMAYKEKSNVDYKIKPAPRLLELSEEEMFRNEVGETVSIEVRGERNVDSAFFRVKDVSLRFKMPNLQHDIVKDRGYKEGLDYVYFALQSDSQNDLQTEKNLLKNKKEVFLTYNGICRLFFSSRSEEVKRFRTWASKMLFTIQMGTIEQKKELAVKILGLNPDTVKEVFNSSHNKTSAIYLYYIGSAKNLVSSTYDKDDMLCKFGCTEDIARRTTEHERGYKKKYGVDSISLLHYAIIDPHYIFDAENNIRTYFKSYKIDEDDKSELVVLNKKNLDSIKKHYQLIQKSYIGRYEEQNTCIQDLKHQLEMKNHELKMKDKELKHQLEMKNNELKMKDNELKHHSELNNKDMVIFQQKIEILELKLAARSYHQQ